MPKSKIPVKYAIVDAFAESAFRGNPAAVFLLEEEREESWLHSVVAELKAPATCFLTRIFGPDPEPDSSSIPKFKLRWFTPGGEGNMIEFSTLSGTLRAKKTLTLESSVSVAAVAEQQRLWVELDFPVIPLIDCNTVDISLISEALGGVSVVDIKRTTTEDDLLVVLSSASAVANLQPNLEKVGRCPCRGIIVSSQASRESEFDFISRFFFPRIGVNEDAVCGSAHCALAFYWSKKLGKRHFLAYAASARSGVVKLHLDDHNNRVRLQGKAITVMEGSLLV